MIFNDINYHSFNVNSADSGEWCYHMMIAITDG